ncbi:MAG: ribonuclease H-like domain-containing protein [Bryobacteraceae bacterium]
MSELQEQLEALRQRVARALEERSLPGFARENSGKFEKPPESAKRRSSLSAAERIFDPLAQRLQSAQVHVEEWLPGEEVETAYGKHYETETLYARHKRHGSADIGSLAELPPGLLKSLSNGAIDHVPPQEWAFLDTETTGLAGGTGTCAFLVGVGRITPEGFRVRQFFMRDYGEEASLLDSLSRHLEPFRVLITYNGRTFDQPLLETRFRMNRSKPPFSRFEHLDLLYGARRLWKLRFDSCRLIDLESQILGFERQGDVPGALIPYIYFEYVRTGEMARLLPVFHHNAIDILTLACLTGIVPYAFLDPVNAPLKHGTELAALGRWLREAGEMEQARTLFRRALDLNLRDEILFRTLWDLAAVERKLECGNAALAIWNDLAGSKNPYQVRACEELAKHFEHDAKDYARALEFTLQAIGMDDTDDLRKREARLRKRAAKPAAKPAAKKRIRSAPA